MVTTLEADDVKLFFVSDANEWCSLRLEKDDQSWDLGADTKNVIARKLSFALDKQHSMVESGTIYGTSVAHVITLFENHYSIYIGRIKNSERTLFFQDKSNNIVATVRLDEKKRADWLEALNLIC